MLGKHSKDDTERERALLRVLVVIDIVAWMFAAQRLDIPVPWWPEFWLAHMAWIGVPLFMASVSAIGPLFLSKKGYLAAAHAAAIGLLLLCVPALWLATILEGLP
jgi:hypothetical protein